MKLCSSFQKSLAKRRKGKKNEWKESQWEITDQDLRVHLPWNIKRFCKTSLIVSHDIFYKVTWFSRYDVNTGFLPNGQCLESQGHATNLHSIQYAPPNFQTREQYLSSSDEILADFPLVSSWCTIKLCFYSFRDLFCDKLFLTWTSVSAFSTKEKNILRICESLIYL